MNPDRLVHMANDIGDFFAAQPDPAEAAAGIATHLRKFWDPRMRRQILAAMDAGQAEGLHPLVAAALRTHRDSLQPGAQSSP
jgi:formate dehydrogenase subunit delta